MNHRSYAALSRLCCTVHGQFTAKHGARFAAGEFIYLRGDPAQSVYFLREGLVRTSIITGAGQEVTTAVYKGGDVFGELCFCSSERLEQATAMEQVEVVETQITEMIARLIADREALVDFIANISHHLVEAHDQILAIVSEKASTRVVRQLLQLAVEFGKQATGGVEIGIYVKQEDLAQMVGATREVVSLCLNHLRASGCIGYTRKGLITVNPKSLEGYLQRQYARSPCEQQPLFLR